jgi:hypothetical protein
MFDQDEEAIRKRLSPLLPPEGVELLVAVCPVLFKELSDFQKSNGDERTLDAAISIALTILGTTLENTKQTHSGFHRTVDALEAGLSLMFAVHHNRGKWKPE